MSWLYPQYSYENEPPCLDTDMRNRLSDMLKCPNEWDEAVAERGDELDAIDTLINCYKAKKYLIVKDYLQAKVITEFAERIQDRERFESDGGGK